MNHNMNRSNFIYQNDLLETVLQLLEFASLLGLLFCGMALSHGPLGIAVPQAVVYGIWFLISIISVYLMQRCYRSGAYMLGTATLIVTVFDVALGYASLGGALLGMLVAILVIAYLRYTRDAF